MLYSASEGAIFPSVNEGALPEFAGNNAIYFDSDNIEQMALVIEQLAMDSALRKKLIAGGIEWTKRFDWSKTAEKTIELLNKVEKK